jgi:acyl carrier protein
MDTQAKQQLRDFLVDTLQKHGDRNPLADSDLLFTSGRLDSFSTMNLVMFLEENFGIDFSDFEFDVSVLDSVDLIEAFVDARA